ncbi:MAG: YggT family protein [Clostridia bacterium]|nr:YggT family protein [Clostridia bacterium]
MRIIQSVRFLLSIYALMQLVHFALPYVTATQSPWMTTLARLCEPGARIGTRAASRLIPDRRFKIDVGPLAAALICYIARIVLGIFFGQ